MTRGKLFFMFGGLCVVAILLWIAAMMQTPAPRIGVAPAVNPSPSPSGDFYITGHVHRPGMFSLKPGATLKDILADAGGADSAPAELIVRIVRKDKDGASSTLSIPLADVLSGVADEKVQLGDVIDIVQQVKPATLPVIPVGGADAPASGLVTPPASQ
jgi:SLBB domain